MQMQHLNGKEEEGSKDAPGNPCLKYCLHNLHQISIYNLMLLFPEPRMSHVNLRTKPFEVTSHVPIQNVPFRHGSNAWPLVLLLAVFLRTAHPNNSTLDAALLWVLSNTPTSTVPVPCLVQADLLAAFSRTARPKMFHTQHKFNAIHPPRVKLIG